MGVGIEWSHNPLVVVMAVLQHRGISVGIPVYIAVVMTITLRRASASYDEAA
jgi:hypothetical protein